MSLLDRHILARFLQNFAILLLLLFLFAVAIDIVLVLDRFIDAGRSIAGADAGGLARLWAVVRVTAGFEAPRLFQFYAYLHGLVAIGAMGFTLVRMYRDGELVAILASGMSMHRLAMPFVVGTFGLSALQLVNHELILPRVAPLLIRGHESIGHPSVSAFPVRLTPDRSGSLLQAPAFDPATAVLEMPTVLERDANGRTRRRITATSATWEHRGDTVGWKLVDGHAVSLSPEAGPDGRPIRANEAIEFFATDLSPEVLTTQRYGEYVSLLGLRQIGRMLAALDGADRQSATDRAGLLRHRYARFSTVVSNVLIMWLVLPFFLLREPAPLLRQALLGAAVAIPAFMGAAIFMMVPLANIPPAASVFLPVAVLVPVVLGQWATVKT